LLVSLAKVGVGETPREAMQEMLDRLPETDKVHTFFEKAMMSSLKGASQDSSWCPSAMPLDYWTVWRKHYRHTKPEEQLGHNNSVVYYGS
jgi:hypothetical protein